MQIAKYITEHQAEIEDLLQRHALGEARSPLQIFFQRRALDEIHHEVPAFCLREMLIDLGQIAMFECRKKLHFPMESSGSLNLLLRTQAVQADSLDGNGTLLSNIPCFDRNAEAPFSTQRSFSALVLM